MRMAGEAAEMSYESLLVGCFPEKHDLLGRNASLTGHARHTEHRPSQNITTHKRPWGEPL